MRFVSTFFGYTPPARVFGTKIIIYRPERALVRTRAMIIIIIWYHDNIIMIHRVHCTYNNMCIQHTRFPVSPTPASPRSTLPAIPLPAAVIICSVNELAETVRTKNTSHVYIARIICVHWNRLFDFAIRYRDSGLK